MIDLPFKTEACSRECGKECGVNLPGCPVYRELPEPLQAVCQENLHLLQYLYMLSRSEMGIPEYHESLNRGMKNEKNRNLIYPVEGGTFVHVLANEEDIRDRYIPVEPSLFQDMGELLEEVEERLADFVDEFDSTGDAAKRLDVILKIVDKMVVVHSGNGSKTTQRDKKGSKKTKDRITLTPAQYHSLRYLLRRKLEGMGVLEPMIRDHDIEDISCSGLGKIFVEHKIFGGLEATIGFETHDELDKFVIQLSEGIKHPVTFRNPCVDATLPDGSRINIVYGIDVSKRGSNFTIRKFSPTPMSIIELIESGAMNYEMAAYLSLVLQESMNVWVSGETASGKTTLMNAVATFIPPEAKVVSIEDTPEVQVPHHNWIRGVTRESGKSTEASAVSMFDLLKAALRQRPNMIIIGEIRGAEGAIAFQAMQTGHATMATFHAATVTKLIQRLAGNPINVPKSYIDNLNIIVITQMVRLPNGRSGRRVTSINEIISYDSVGDAFSFIESFVWNPINDTFDFKGHMNSYMLEYKIAPRRGIPHDKRREVYATIKQRAKVLQRFQEQNITNFYDVYAYISKAYRDGHFR